VSFPIQHFFNSMKHIRINEYALYVSGYRFLISDVRDYCKTYDSILAPNKFAIYFYVKGFMQDSVVAFNSKSERDEAYDELVKFF